MHSAEKKYSYRGMIGAVGGETRLFKSKKREAESRQCEEHLNAGRQECGSKILSKKRSTTKWFQDRG